MAHNPLRIETDPVYRNARRIGDLEEALKNLDRRTGGLTLGVEGPEGPQGPEGPAGKDGTSAGLAYNYSNSTAMEDPGAGNIRFNNGTPSAATKVAIDNSSLNGSVQAYLETWDDSTSATEGHLIIKKYGTSTTFLILKIKTVTMKTGWVELEIEPIAAGGSWTNNDDMDIGFYRVGDKGDKGEKGDTGPEGPAGGGAKDWGIVEALPSEAEVGNTCTFKVAAGIYWQLRKTGEETYPWAYVGGPPLYAFIHGNSSRASSTYGDLASGAGPTVTVPLKGEYDILHGARRWTGPNAQDQFCSYVIGETAANDEDAITWYHSGLTVEANYHGTMSRRKTVSSASSAITLKYKTASGGSAEWAKRWLRVTPLRVG